MAGGKFSLANLFGMTIRESANDGSDFTNPDADYRRLFLGEDGLLHVKDSAGAVTDPYTGGSGVLQSASATRTAGDLTTTSNPTFVDATSLTTTITTGAHRCLVSFFCSVTSNDGSHIGIDIDVDGTRLGSGNTWGLQMCAPPANNDYAAMCIYVRTAVLSAASHTIKVQWRAGGGTAKMAGSTSLAPPILTVIETGLTT